MDKNCRVFVNPSLHLLKQFLNATGFFSEWYKFYVSHDRIITHYDFT